MFLTHTPAPPLSAFVSALWLHVGEPAPHARDRILPTGRIGMVINLHEDEIRTYDRETGQVRRTRGVTVAGACSEYFMIDTAEQRWCMGVEFTIGGAFPFFGRPASELRDEAQIPLDALWGEVDLRGRLLAAATPEEKLRALEQALLGRMARGPERHPAVDYALREFLQVPQTRTIAEVTDQIGMSPRRFIQVFSEQVGLTPKRFCRVRRFHEVIRRVHKGRDIDWTEVALSYGYFDQAHFIRDFKAFSGLNPSAYLIQRGEHLNHVPIPD
jgi:AraC-like DNA-binding protein